ncbi:DegT/DnrJ/EryC1/StrS family aminotransferase [Streptomyces sp. NPDC048442]|uniref:DegT/DnrJ/EryC1/StrS family aminotransferase n=1 Tax=Streptomyces sp. NPDC048442 TaxID=3154823 RepID=UPI0034300DD5
MRTLGIALSQAARPPRPAPSAVSASAPPCHPSMRRSAPPSWHSSPALAARRQELWRTYSAALRGLDGVAPDGRRCGALGAFTCVVRVPSRDTAHRILRDQGIGVGVHYPPNHLQPAFAPWHRSLPVTERIGREILSLPFHPALTNADVRHVAGRFDEALASPAPDTCTRHLRKGRPDVPSGVG